LFTGAAGPNRETPFAERGVGPGAGIVLGRLAVPAEERDCKGQGGQSLGH